jgi:hypothetical protein
MGARPVPGTEKKLGRIRSIRLSINWVSVHGKEKDRWKNEENKLFPEYKKDVEDSRPGLFSITTGAAGGVFALRLSVSICPEGR